MLNALVQVELHIILLLVLHSLVRYEPSEVHVLIEVWYMYALLLRPFCYMPHNVNLCCGRDTRMHMLPFRACAGMIPTPPHKLAF